MDGIVDNNHVFEFPIFENSEVLYVDTFVENAGFSEESAVNGFLVFFQIVENNVGVAGVACRENDNFVNLAHFFKKFQGIRTDINRCLNHLSTRELNVQSCVSSNICIVAMDQGFI